MYTGNAARIYNPRPDPAERGPPKRVAREESHIGEMVAASKKRISWKFSLGESDATHEVVLVHSIMSYKKVVEFDGRQMHYSATFTPGDWKFLMILDGSNHVFEVRINDLESADVPKYDLAVDRIPFRRWDVYRRRKQPITTSTYALSNAQQQQQQTSTFGTQRWGPNGMSAPPPAEPMGRPGQYSHHGGGAQNRSPEARSNSFGTPRDSGGGGHRGSFGNDRGSFGNDRGSFGNDRGSFGNDRGSFGNASPPYPQQQRQQQQQRRPSQSGQYGAPAAPQSAQSPPAPMQTKTHAPPPQKKQPEINLIDDFGPSVSVPAQALLFDPLAGSTFAAQTGGNPSPQQQQQHHQKMNPRTSSSPAFAPPYNAQIQPNPTPYVDPFANVPQAAPLKPTQAPINFNQFAAPSNGYPQQQQQQQQRPPQNGGMYQPTNFQQQPQQPMQIGGTPVAPMMGVQQPGMAMANGGRMTMPITQQQQQQPAVQQQPVRIDAPVNMNSPVVNYNISQLMNPVDVNGFQQQSQQPKSINIDAFAGMKG